LSVNAGAYLLHFRLRRPALVTAGRLGRYRFEPGRYVYVGSARRHLAQRVARHRRLATTKEGARHWHIDGVLLHRYFVLERSEIFPDADECRLSAELGRLPGVTVPVPGFGATDCAAGCRSHFYRVAEPDGAA
jgi:Uri superfamily endonuclease